VLSVLIPAREEKYLQPTITSILEAARGEIEIIVVLDGYQPSPPIKEDPHLVLVHNEKAQGQRQAINQAARLAKGEYIIKTDAHSMFDNGFDLKLIEDCEYDWTVIPRMYNLNVETWLPKTNKVTDFMWINSFDAPTINGRFKPFRVQYWDAKTARQYPKEYKAYKDNPNRKDDICDVMTGQGACFFMHMKRFWELGGMDENHGHWGQMGVEVALKAWLSGGSLKVNKKTWFAHYFRGGSGPGFPWLASGRSQEEARKYSRRLWSSGTWPLQKRPLDWLLDKFAPLPNWNGQKYPINKDGAPIPASPYSKKEIVAGSKVTLKEDLAKLKNLQKEVSTDVVISVIMPARNEKYMQKTLDGLAENMTTPYEVLVGLDNYTPDPPIKEADNLTIYHSKERVGTRVLLNKLISMAKGKYLLRLDPHCLIAKGMDTELLSVHKPGNTIVPSWYQLDAEKWIRRESTRCDYRYLTHPIDEDGGLRSLRWPGLTKKYSHIKVDEVMTCSGSVWLVDKEEFLSWGGLDENHGQIGQEGVEIACKTWLSGGRLLVNKNTWYAHYNRGKAPYAIGRSQRKISLKYSNEFWPNDRWHGQTRNFRWLVKHIGRRQGRPPGWSLKDAGLTKTQKVYTHKHSYGFGTKRFKVDELYKNYLNYVVYYKKDPEYIKSAQNFHKAFRPFVDSLVAGKEYTDDELKNTLYYRYLVGHLAGSLRPDGPDGEPTVVGLKRVFTNMKNSIKLFKSIQAEGMNTPLDFWRDGKKRVLQRGQRRVVILKKLGIKEAVGRVFKTKDLYKAVIDRFDVRSGGLIEKAAQRQFAKFGRDATDKYFSHNFTHYYDRKLAGMHNRPIKILEIGVKQGASVVVFQEAFPQAQVFGIDIKDVSDGLHLKGRNDIKLFVGDQADKKFLKTEIVPYGPFDVIIDDGCHIPGPIKTSLETLWPVLAPRGVYVIEDMWHSVYHVGGRPVLMDKIHQMVERVFSTKDVLSLECHLNICFIEKT
tara:strand:+ start:1247 stop:4210 length:2964 start_codon:yes stop_codon:yes gene_type:complete